MAKSEKPLPEISTDKKPFWEAASRGELLIMKCSTCGHLRYPLYAGDSYLCPQCNTREAPQWITASGKGKILTWTVIHRAFHPAFAEETPYIVALAEMQEGIRMYGNIRNVKPENIQQGLPVEVYFEKLNNEIFLPQFKLVTT